MPLNRLFQLLLLTCALITAGAAFADSDDDDNGSDESEIYGWIENTELIPWGVEVKAKLDTAALTSSLHATHIDVFERDDEDWVSFTVNVEDQDSKEMVDKKFELPLYRDLTVSGAGGTDHRPVVLLNVCMGDKIYEQQFSLRDRSEMTYPMLIGRRMLQHLGPISVIKTFEHEPTCEDDDEIMEYDPDDQHEHIGA